MFYDRYLELCQSIGKRPYSVAKELGMKSYSSIIAQWMKGSTPRPDTLLKIADYFNVSVEYLTSGQKETPAPSEGDRLNDSQLMFALWGDSSEITKEDLDDVRRYAEFVAQRKKEKK